jgi:hypothetical protein
MVFGGKTWCMKTIGRPRSIWVDNIEMDLQAYTDHSNESRRTKWKKLTTDKPNGLYHLVNVHIYKHINIQINIFKYTNT